MKRKKSWRSPTRKYMRSPKWKTLTLTKIWWFLGTTCTKFMARVTNAPHQGKFAFVHIRLYNDSEPFWHFYALRKFSAVVKKAYYSFLAAAGTVHNSYRWLRLTHNNILVRSTIATTPTTYVCFVIYNNNIIIIK